ncbi:class I SAM-dependent methyltransferase [Bacillus infantis]|uniref:class I SAM-dependent methyltransferase n=1 Tax=Bacillus infantis TaxID=324767 RepID=UPI003CEA8130
MSGLETIRTAEDVMNMLDFLLKEESSFQWDQFYERRGNQVPFFRNVPDENLAAYFNEGKIKAGRVLELGCGPGRNAIYMAGKGCTVDAVDSSKEALNWARERVRRNDVDITFVEADIFQLDQSFAGYDFIYDSGCFHHIPPHRRADYFAILRDRLKPNGFFALTCFEENGELGGSAQSDWDVYRERSMKGGLGFTEEKLLHLFSDYRTVEIRPMKKKNGDDAEFGVTGLLTALFQKKE